MAKKVKKSSMGKYLTLAAILFAVASVCMIFVNAVKYQVSERIVVIAGGKVVKDGVKDEILPEILSASTCGALEKAKECL